MDDQKIPILIFSSLADIHVKKIEHALRRLSPDIAIISCPTVKALSEHILQILFGLGIILILIRSDKEMKRVLELRQKLKDHDILLILEESEIQGMQETLDLYPRYISYIKDDYTDVIQVLEKMIMKIKTGGKNGG